MMRALVLCLLLPSGLAFAVPGPDSVAVIANGNDMESVALAQLYIEARDIPAAHLCLLDLPMEHTIDLAAYQSQLLQPLEDCLRDRALLDRIEALVLVRGVPLRVTIEAEGRSQRASVAAALGVWRSSTSTSGASILDRTPGAQVPCGQNQTCLGARWLNPYTSGTFEPGYTAASQGIDFQLMLVTALTGRTYADAALLVASATTADAEGGAEGQFLFMNGADAARGALDGTYDLVIRQLENRGYTDVERIPFDSNLTGRRLASFFVGTANLGDTIEGNEYAPGALVDNLTSFGAVPENFALPEDERQVSIARWVAQGVAGVHGTTDEPLNNCFPSRRLIVDYVDGYTLAESYHRNLPFIYWRNLVIGDPIAAPYAARPQVRIEGLSEGEQVDGAAEVQVRLQLAGGVVIDNLALFVDGVELVREPGGLGLDRCLVFDEPGEHQVLAVAQYGRDNRAKGWAAVTVESVGRRTSCEAPDAGVVDLGAPDRGQLDLGSSDLGMADAGVGPGPVDLGQVDAGALEEEGGCTCVRRPRGLLGFWVLGMGLVVWGAWRRREGV